MKGPGHRYDIDIRRLWECPECGKQIRLPANIAHQQCSCHENKSWMRLVPIDRIRTFPVRERIDIPEEYDEPEVETTASEIAPPSETTESSEEIVSTTPEESASVQTAADDSGSSTVSTTPADPEQVVSTDQDKQEASPESSTRTESVNTTIGTENNPTDSQEQTPRKKTTTETKSQTRPQEKADRLQSTKFRCEFYSSSEFASRHLVRQFWIWCLIHRESGISDAHIPRSSPVTICIPTRRR